MPVTVWQSWMSPLQTAIAKAEAGIFCVIDEAALTRSLNQLADTQKDSSALRAALLAEMKTQLAEARSRLAARLHAERDGADYVGAHAHALDVLIRSVLILASQHIFARKPGFGLMAVGGYGRGELAPHSDIDLLFVMPEHAAKKQEPVI